MCLWDWCKENSVDQGGHLPQVREKLGGWADLGCPGVSQFPALHLTALSEMVQQKQGHCGV
jgi:hypothetical protein